jgi:hypothetical protein
MSALIEELKKEHSKIVATLDEIEVIGILSKEGKSKLLSVKTHLLTHLKKEDEQLYPALRKEAKSNKQVKNTLELFAIDMEDVSRIVLEFFDKYSGGVLGMEFHRDFDSLFVALSTRIRNEENILYAEYEKMN